MQDEISGCDFITLWHRYFRYGYFTQTECAPAHFTIKMNMLVIVMFVLAVAEFIAYASAAIINHVDQVMVFKQAECTENT